MVFQFIRFRKSKLIKSISKILIKNEFKIENVYKFNDTLKFYIQVNFSWIVFQVRSNFLKCFKQFIFQFMKFNKLLKKI